ncbi:hypothetical protein E3P77_00486 [Wallemia ichthyophaga]|nr:hypothetical protein E3P77_00486 [Wallemia ichthyophaga]
MKLSMILLAGSATAALARDSLFKRGQSLEHAVRQSPELAAQMIRRHYDDQGNPLCKCPSDHQDQGSHDGSKTWWGHNGTHGDHGGEKSEEDCDDTNPAPSKPDEHGDHGGHGGGHGGDKGEEDCDDTNPAPSKPDEHGNYGGHNDDKGGHGGHEDEKGGDKSEEDCDETTPAPQLTKAPAPAPSPKPSDNGNGNDKKDEEDCDETTTPSPQPTTTPTPAPAPSPKPKDNESEDCDETTTPPPPPSTSTTPPPSTTPAMQNSATPVVTFTNSGKVTSAAVSGTPTSGKDDGNCGDSTALIDLDTGLNIGDGSLLDVGACAHVGHLLNLGAGIKLGKRHAIVRNEYIKTFKRDDLVNADLDASVLSGGNNKRNVIDVDALVKILNSDQQKRDESGIKIFSRNSHKNHHHKMRRVRNLA